MTGAASLRAARYRAFRDDLAFAVVPLGREKGDAILARWDAMEAALDEIAAHPVISESAVADDNCDWHCSAEMVARAKDALNG
jgi:hypothetical protein